MKDELRYYIRNIKYIDECPYFLSKKKEKKCYPT